MAGLMTLASLVGAQNIPNGGFENWSNDTSFNLDSWNIAGSVTRSTDAVEGGVAVRLDNTVNNQSRAFVATAPIGPGGIKGIPYDEAPLSMRFYAKYNLALGDRAQVVAAFTNKGNYIAVTSFLIEGNSADTFTYFSIPIQYQISTLPDSVAILISSIELDSNRVNGDGYLIIDDLHFASISTRNKALPNGKFNSWTEQYTQKLDFWLTTDSYLKQVSGQSFNPPLVRKTTDSHGGQTAVELTSRNIGQDTLPGVIFSGKDPEQFEKPSFPVTQKWKYIEGYYKFDRQNNDSAFVGVGLFKNGVPIGGAQAALVTPQTGWTYFAFELSYLVDITPDSATVMFTNANPDAPRGTGSVLTLDDIQFTNQNLGVFNLFANKLTVYPNPFQDEIHITGLDRLEGARYVVRDATGLEFRSGEVVQDMTIDMRDAGAGIYFLHIEGRHVLTDKILLKE